MSVNRHALVQDRTRLAEPVPADLAGGDERRPVGARENGRDELDRQVRQLPAVALRARARDWAANATRWRLGFERGETGGERGEVDRPP